MQSSSESYVQAPFIKPWFHRYFLLGGVFLLAHWAGYHF